MARNALWRSGLAVCALLVAACHDSTSPAALTIALSPPARTLGIDQDSVVSVLVDSARVSLRGGGAASARWTASHGAAAWLSLVSTAGANGDAVRWVVDPTGLIPGTYVDTIAIAALDAPRQILVDSLVIRGTPAELVTVTRLWLPGEQAATIAAAQSDHTTLPYVGDISGLAPQLYGGDSVTVVVPNPLYQAAAGGPPRVAQFSTGWSAVGVSLSIQDRSAIPWDTLSWLGVMWWNPADATWKGWTLGASKATTFALRTVSTSAFDASGGSSGAGGGEAQQSTGTYWEASGGQVQMSKNNNCGSTTTIGSGVWKGGTTRTCRFGGRLVNLSMPRSRCRATGTRTRCACR